MRTLVLVRHAEAYPYAPADRDRPLTPHGGGQATRLGEWLRGEGIIPTHALVSDALRTRETWAALAEAAGLEVFPEFDAGLYAAGPESALDLVQAIAPESGTLLVLGHNPTIAYLAQVLCDDDGDPEASMALLRGFPPASAAVFEVAAEWGQLAPGKATLRAFRPGT